MSNEIFLTIITAIFSSTELLAVLTAFLLSIIPGPFRGIAQGIISMLIARAKTHIDGLRDAAAEDAVLMAEQMSGSNAAKLKMAVEHVQNRTGAGTTEAEQRVEAKVKEVKSKLEPVLEMKALTAVRYAEQMQKNDKLTNPQTLELAVKQFSGSSGKTGSEARAYVEAAVNRLNEARSAVTVNEERLNELEDELTARVEQVAAETKKLNQFIAKDY